MEKVTKQQIDKAKNFPMSALLEYFGYMPCEQNGNELIYFSPFRTEKTPSFRVNVKGNVCKDFGDNENSGDVIRLYSKLKNCTFLTAVHDLMNNKINAANSCQFVRYEPIVTKEKTKPEIVEIKPTITNPNLIHYLESRCINPETANLFCKEIHYKQPNGKVYYSLGFENNSGGWELRSANFKSCVGKKDLTEIGKKNNPAKVSIFEGFFNFLSYIELKGNFDFNNEKIIVLNSTALAKKVNIESASMVCLILDNDDSGRKASDMIESNLEPKINSGKIGSFCDYSGRLETDLNDYLVNRKSKLNL